MLAQQILPALLPHHHYLQDLGRVVAPVYRPELEKIKAKARKEKKMKRKKSRMDMLAQQILAMQEELEEVELLVDLEESNTVVPIVATRKPVLERPTEEVDFGLIQEI